MSRIWNVPTDEYWDEVRPLVAGTASRPFSNRMSPGRSTRRSRPFWRTLIPPISALTPCP